ncbi:MAG: MaoC family dehydratase [Halobacteriales archaeon]
MTRYFEDLTVGDRYETGTYEMTAEEIVSFAERYDPQPIHVDEAAARETIFGGLIASGWHTASACMRLLVDDLYDDAWVAARGVDRLRWIRPVRPGDVLAVAVAVVDKNPRPGPDGVGEVHLEVTGTNADDEAVISWVALSLVKCRG